LLKSARSAAAAGLHDHIAIRQPGAHAHRAALRVVSPPSVVVAAVDMLTHDDVVTITDDNFRGRGKSAHKHSADGRTQNDHFHFSLLCFPRDQETSEFRIGFSENLF
jgi:hypothetical protein